MNTIQTTISKDIDSLHKKIDANHETMINLVGGTAYSMMKAINGDKEPMKAFIDKCQKSGAKSVLLQLRMGR